MIIFANAIEANIKVQHSTPSTTIKKGKKEIELIII